jgi:integrase
MALTDLQIKKISPQKNRFEVSDGDGLSVRVMPSGSKSFVFRYLFEGIPRRMTLGVYNPSLSKSKSNSGEEAFLILGKLPFLTLSEARGLHARARAMVARGIDPGSERKAALDTRKAVPTFEEMIREFWEIELREKKSGMERRRLLEKDGVPAWGKRKVTDIKRRDIVLLLDQVRDRAPITANRFHGVLARFFNFCAERGTIEDSPCTRIRKNKEKGRSRVLTDEEIKSLWAALDLENKKVDIYRVSKLALKMILVTGQRPGEICGMTWKEIGEDRIWTLPAERSKNQEDHRVPLTDMAIEILQAVRPYSGESDFIFRSSFKDNAPMSRHALSRAITRHWKEMGFQEKFNPHDLRRTMRTRLAELGISDIVAERVLGHKLQGMLAVYNRHPYDEEKRQALEQWEAKLKKIMDDLPKESCSKTESGKDLQSDTFETCAVNTEGVSHG